MTAPAATVPVAVQTGSSLATSWNNCTTSFQDKFNKYVDWTSKNSFECVKGNFGFKLEGTVAEPADGTLKKVGKLFAMLVASIALLPIALVGCAYNWVKDLVCGAKAAANQPTAPPAATPPAVVENAQANAAAVVPAPAQQPAVVENAQANAPANAAAVVPAPAPAPAEGQVAQLVQVHQAAIAAAAAPAPAPAAAAVPNGEPVIVNAADVVHA